jgi:putative membrane protein insertion efficiency factor
MNDAGRQSVDLPRLAQAVASLPSWLLLGAIGLYRRTLSPVLPVVFGPGCGCRFHPTCSAYAAQAVRDHGAIAGTWLALRRLVKCHPLHPGGFDPVPARLRPTCSAVPRSVVKIP